MLNIQFKTQISSRKITLTYFSFNEECILLGQANYTYPTTATRCYGLVELKLEVVHLLLNIYYISLQMFEHKLLT